MKRTRTYFTPTIDRYFTNWIHKESWDAPHPLDQRRFHLFVMALHRKSNMVGANHDQPHPRTYDPEMLTTKIIQAVKDKWPDSVDEAVEERAAPFSKEATRLLEFLWNTQVYPSLNVHW